MSLQSWSSKGGTLKRWMCLWSDLGRTRVLAEIPNITRYYKAKKKKQGRGPMPHTKASQTSDGLNFWGGFISQKDLQFMKKWLPILHYFESLTLTWICVPCHLSSRLIGTSQPPHNITQEDNHWNIILVFLFRTPKSLLHIHHLFGR